MGDVAGPVERRTLACLFAPAELEVVIGDGGGGGKLMSVSMAIDGAGGGAVVSAGTAVRAAA